MIVFLLACTPERLEETGPRDGDSVPLEDSAVDSTPPTDTGESGETAETGTETGTETGESGEPVDTGEVPAYWSDFVAARDGWLGELGVPVVACTTKHDTGHPVFDGCVDWHSCVHGTWALLALYRLTGDSLYGDLADELLDVKGLELELDEIESGQRNDEIPYGFAWFLKLAIEREQTSGVFDLEPLADEVANRLEHWVGTIEPAEVEDLVLSDDYANLSWALLNLHAWAVWKGDPERAARVEAHVREWLVPLDAACPLEADADAIEFFPPCLHRARAIVEVLPPEEAATWMKGFLPETLELDPLTTFDPAHQAGQNFSRSWGLWALWVGSGEQQYRIAYADHVTTHMGMPEYWEDDYWSYSHWIPQFGIYGLALGYE